MKKSGIFPRSGPLWGMPEFTSPSNRQPNHTAAIVDSLSSIDQDQKDRLCALLLEKNGMLIPFEVEYLNHTLLLRMAELKYENPSRRNKKKE